MHALLSPATMWSLIAAAVAVACEYFYRTVPNPWGTYWYIFVPLQSFIGYSIYKLVTVPGAPLIGALIVWSFATIFMRVVVSAVILRDDIAPGVWMALVLMTIARVTQSYWR